jgi:hypothetical protein
LVGGMLFFRQASGLLAAVAIFGMLWAASLGYTAAGFTYSLRVLNPALVITTVLGGAALARLVPGQQSRNVVVFALCLFATDAALRVLVLPANIYRVPISKWLHAGRALDDYHRRPVYRELVRVAGNERILVLGPNALLAMLGARTVPLWSPEMRYIFDPALSSPEIARRLRASNIGFVLLNTGAVNDRFVSRSKYFRDPEGTLRGIWSDDDMEFLRVNLPVDR